MHSEILVVTILNQFGIITFLQIKATCRLFGMASSRTGGV